MDWVWCRKSGAVWRINPRTTSEQLPNALCVPLDRIVDLTDKLSVNGRLTWDVPEGKWTILRIGSDIFAVGSLSKSVLSLNRRVSLSVWRVSKVQVTLVAWGIWRLPVPR